MSTNKIKTASSLTADTTQARYQKALKQITKLVNINTSLRQNQKRNEEYIKQLTQKLQAIEEIHKKTEQQRAKLEEETKALTIQKKYLLKQNQQIKLQCIKLKGLKISIQSQLKHKQSKQSYQDSSKSDQPFKILSNMERVLQLRNQTINQLQKKIKKLQQANNSNIYKINYSEAIKADINNNQLNKKLHVANDYIEKVNAENVDLKSKLIRAQSRNKLLSVKSLQVFPQYSPQQTTRTINNYLPVQPKTNQQAIKRYHKLEEENRKISRKYQSNKHELTVMQQQMKKLKKQNKKFSAQVTGYEALITKQQQIISQLHTSYDQEVMRMTDQFKQKLIDQRENFSPAKSADHLKQIDGLQLQNRNLKKKFQLCSIQLTKCFKTLQIYKAKLKQCQRDYGQLINQRDQLNEKVNRLQASHREKSSYSRSSNSKIPVDPDRRNSMGETGHFNTIT